MDKIEQNGQNWTELKISVKLDKIEKIDKIENLDKIEKFNKIGQN